jgi:hypothetical protein
MFIELLSTSAEGAFKCLSKLSLIDVVADIDEFLSGQSVQRFWQSKMNMTERI